MCYFRFTRLLLGVLSAVTPENLDKFLKAIGRESSYVDFEVWTRKGFLLIFCKIGCLSGKNWLK
jgi:hypothetical protein